MVQVLTSVIAMTVRFQSARAGLYRHPLQMDSCKWPHLREELHLWGPRCPPLRNMEEGQSLGLPPPDAC